MSVLPSLCSSVRMEQLGPSGWIFMKFEYFSKVCRKISSFIKTNKNNGQFTWKPIYIVDHISFSSSEREMFQTKVLEKIRKHILCSITFFENRVVREIMWKNIVEPGRPQITRCIIRISFMISKATIADSEYAIFIAFLLQQWLHERATMLHDT